MPTIHPDLARSIDVRIVSDGFNWALAGVAVSLAGVVVALVIAVLNLRHDSKGRRDQRDHDSNERQKEREADQARQQQAERDAAKFRARNVIGGPPARMRVRAGLPDAVSAAQVDGGGPTIINASDSIITNVYLIGATTPLDPWHPSVGRLVWYRRRRSDDGKASVVLPHDEVEFPANWLEEIEEDGQQHVRKINPGSVMYWGIRIAFEWTDSTGTRWIRFGEDDPQPKHAGEDQVAGPFWEWVSKNPPDD